MEVVIETNRLDQDAQPGAFLRIPKTWNNVKIWRYDTLKYTAISIFESNPEWKGKTTIIFNGYNFLEV